MESSSLDSTEAVFSPPADSKPSFLMGLFKEPRSRAMSDSDTTRKSKSKKSPEKRMSFGFDLLSSSPRSSPNVVSEKKSHQSLRRVSSMPTSQYAAVSSLF